MTSNDVGIFRGGGVVNVYWNGEFGNYLGFDDGTAAEGVTFGSENMTLAPGTLANKTNYLYYATIWG